MIEFIQRLLHAMHYVLTSPLGLFLLSIGAMVGAALIVVSAYQRRCPHDHTWFAGPGDERCSDCGLPLA